MVNKGVNVMNFENVVAVRKNKTIYRDGDKLIKLFDESHSVASVLNEALNQARIMETGLNIPNLQEVSKVDNKWVIVMDFIEGKTLEDLIKENPEKTDDYLNIFVKTQIEIHSKTSMLLRKLHDKMESKIDRINLSDAVKFDLESKLAGLKKHIKVLHGDYQLSNVIVGQSGKVYVIDWSHATQGNASADVAMSYLLMKLNKKDGLAEKYLDLFCSLTNTDKRYVQTWIPIVAASHLEKYQGNERLMLENFINVVEY